MNILIAVLFMLVPAPIIYLNNRVKWVNKLGIVLICYILGIIVGNIGILPESFSGIQSTMQDVSVCLALPLILFSLDLKKWLKTAKKGIICMLLAIVSISVVVFALHLIFGASDPNTPQYAGLAMGVYTGGTPNIASIKTAIGVDETTYTMFNTYDMVISIGYILLLTSGAKAVFKKVFRLRDFEGDKNVSRDDTNNDTADPENYKGFFKPQILGKVLLAVLLSGVILAISYVVGEMATGYETAVTILLVTTLAIVCSFIKPVREIRKTTQTGMYLIYVFCFTVATMADIKMLVNINWTILSYVFFSIFGSMILHALLCKAAKIDADTMIITSTSAICSPPFVPVVAASLKNNAALLSGIATGIIGYAIGNYLGIGTYWLLERLPF
ncbi:MAG: DUF819 family protein [Ruminococcaceae bacterium]|nr:DUF819 family protein [Oscillospiraceae bacterium]